MYIIMILVTGVIINKSIQYEQYYYNEISRVYDELHKNLFMDWGGRRVFI